jgi:hypothetical protein
MTLLVLAQSKFNPNLIEIAVPYRLLDLGEPTHTLVPCWMPKPVYGLVRLNLDCRWGPNQEYTTLL